MDISLIIKVAGIGILVSVATQILSKSGRDEQAMLVTLTGIVVVLLLLVDEIAQRYTPQIASRLQGSFTRLTFVGQDIRVMKNR